MESVLSVDSSTITTEQSMARFNSIQERSGREKAVKVAQLVANRVLPVGNMPLA
jgi:hypothetical protein